MKTNSKIAIVADSTHDFTFELGERFNVKVLSYYIEMGDKTYKDLVDIDSRTFYQTMKNHDTLSSGIPPIQDVINLLDQIKDEGYEEVIMISSSAKLTGMYNLHAVVKETYEGLNIHIFESGQIAAGAGLMTIRAAALRDQGLSATEIVDELEKAKQNMYTYALFRTLKYVVKGGRFNKYAGMIGNILKINPLISLEDGNLNILKKIRGPRKSLMAMANEIRKDIADSKRFNLIVFSGDNDDEIAELKGMLSDLIERAELFIETELTSVLGVHAGPKSIGVSAMLLD